MSSISSESQLVGPIRHTVFLIAVFLVLAAAGASLGRDALAAARTSAAHQPLVRLYLSLLAAEWGLVYFVWKGSLQRRGTTLVEFIGGRWARPVDAVRDVVPAAGVWGAWLAADYAWRHLFPQASGFQALPILPVTTLEIVLWIALSVSAGFTEELVFRGYFQRQFRALTGSVAAALCLQAILFGISHGYQGFWPCVRITVYGLLFGALAEWRHSLRPGMIAHAWTDIISGLSG